MARNEDIRIAIIEAGVKHWQVAEALGINNTSFSRSLRYEIPEKKRKRIFEAINRLKTGAE